MSAEPANILAPSDDAICDAVAAARQTCRIHLGVDGWAVQTRNRSEKGNRAQWTQTKPGGTLDDALEDLTEALARRACSVLGGTYRGRYKGSLSERIADGIRPRTNNKRA